MSIEEIKLDLDAEHIIFKKLDKVKAKYPVDKTKGSATKYTKL